MSKQIIVVEYEIAPTRAVHTIEYHDDGQGDNEIIQQIKEDHPRWRVLTIKRQEAN